MGAAACLGIFWAVTHFADRLGRLYLVWGCVVAAFVLNAALALVQIVGQADGMYGFLQPGTGPDLGSVGRTTCSRRPATAVLRKLGPAAAAVGGAPAFETDRACPRTRRSCSEP